MLSCTGATTQYTCYNSANLKSCERGWQRVNPAVGLLSGGVIHIGVPRRWRHCITCGSVKRMNRMRGGMYDQYHQAPTLTHKLPSLYTHNIATIQVRIHCNPTSTIHNKQLYSHYIHTQTIFTIQPPSSPYKYHPHHITTILIIQAPFSPYLQAHTYPLLICCIILLYISLNITRYSSSPKTI